MSLPESRWPVVVAFAALGVATQVCWLAYAPMTTEAAAHFGVSEQAVGWLANIFPLLFIVLAIPAGAALDRRGRGRGDLGVRRRRRGGGAVGAAAVPRRASGRVVPRTGRTWHVVARVACRWAWQAAGRVARRRGGWAVAGAVRGRARCVVA
ncbi:hypothetical protein [Actinokineospora iranica]|uniref:hypothetical protein n=1 Tax=Actinokineospora iranica TaxID=1271860 RepID=UPI001587CDF9|nr:hypothetical protein [Actinokineospora iranica]